MKKVKILKGCVADGATLAAGEIAEVKDNTARALIGAGQAEEAKDAPAKKAAAKKVAVKKDSTVEPD